MPTTTSWPGVYIEELPSGSRPISGVATSVTAFVGRARRGAVDEVITCTSWADFQRACGGLWEHSELGYAVQQFFGNGGGRAVVSRVASGATAASTAVAGATAGNLALAAHDPGSWGDALRVTVDHGTPDTVSAISDADVFHLTIDEIDPAVEATQGYDRAVITRESFAHLSVDPQAPRFVEGVLEQRSQLARVTAVPQGRPNAVTRQPFTSGEDGTTAAVSDADITDAIERLTSADIVNLVCIPPLDRDTPATTTSWTTALDWCERHRAVLLVDPSPAWGDVQDAADLAAGWDAFRNPNAVYYYPRIVASDPLQQGLPRPFAPSGAVAGVIARTDADRGVWKAPAGADATLRGIAGFESTLTDDDSGTLNPRGVNALRALPAAGPVVWGARTARGADVMASEWKYLPVRRTALFIEESLARGTQWAVFEPNDLGLWSQLRVSIGAFMHDLFVRGAFQGADPRDAYLVRCDETTTTPADVAAGVVNVLVGFAPLRPAEFVILRFQQLAGQSSA